MELHRVGPIVVGSGISGLSTALGLQGALVITSGELHSGSSHLAQGGIAAAIGEGDSAAAHAVDTVAVSAGIADPGVVALVTTAAPDRIAWLAALGARFDPALGREAGHSARRIVHANGDATGAEVMRALEAAVRTRDDITVRGREQMVDLILDGDRVVGVLTLDRTGSFRAYLGTAVVLATGGIGRLYARTTNPPEVAAAGLAAAARAGATLADLEFVQFHPTALAGTEDPAPLLTEALRGDGAVLVDDEGRRFVDELAPRDVVARAIWDQIAAGNRVYLDATTAIGGAYPERFPTVWDHAVAAGLDARTQPIPIEPAEHYHMGGVATDVDGHTSRPGLWAAGEVASTGLHGANRLASNSLLEGLALGARVAVSIASATTPPAPQSPVVPATAFAVEPSVDRFGEDRIRTTMWEQVGIVRSEASLRRAARRLRSLPQPSSLITRNLRDAGRLVTEAALARRESRGAHYRSDYPEPDPSLAVRSLVTPARSDAIPIRPAVAA